MEDEVRGRLLASMEELDERDFRVKGRTKFKASEIALITLCALVTGATSYYDIAGFAEEAEDWLRSILELRNGVPSHDAIRYFWTHLPPPVFSHCFMNWIDSFLELADGDCVNIDGKCLRRAASKSGKIPCIVSAYSSNERIVIGQVKTDEKSNEITAIPKLLESLHLTGCIVTIDAAGCQRKISRKVREKHADYMLALKDNQKLLLEGVDELFETKFKDRETRFRECSRTDKGHGRVTTRTCCHTDYLEWMSGKDRDGWADLTSVCRVETETLKLKTGETTKDVRYFISSMPINPEKALRTVVAHWDVENPLHWTLDMVMDEDHSRARAGFAAENLAVMRHFIFDFVRRDKVTEGGIKRKLKTLTWNRKKLKQSLLAA